MRIRPAGPEDLRRVLAVERAAFPTPEEAELVAALLADPTAEPVLNLLAECDGSAIGHILFTGASLQWQGGSLPASLLAPLAVIPERQRQGVGLALIEAGVAALAAQGIGLVFVLGHIDYYPLAGFRPALPLGLTAPYPIDPAVADAWMVRELRPDQLGSVSGVLRCADALMRPELWREADPGSGAAGDGDRVSREPEER